MRPRSAETSEPAWVKRKMLSMKSSTSWPWSRKYSRGGQAGETDAQTRSGRLVHLTVDEHGLLDDARLLHLDPEVGALAGALAHAGEHGRAAVRHGEVVDELHDDDGLADAGAAEQAVLPPLM